MIDPRAARESERGILMAGVLVLIAIMLIFSTIIFQSWEQVQRRGNEAEMIFRGQEIVRALVRYRKDRGATPENLEQLLEPGSKAQYFIRQLYKDPLVKDGKWGLLYFGPGGGILDPNAPEELFDGGDPSSRGGLAGGGQPGGGLTPAGPGGTARDAGRPGGQGPGFGSGDPLSLEESVAGGVQLPGTPIAGVRSLCTDKPFRVYKGQAEYSKWLFTLLDIERPAAPGQPPGTPGSGGQAGPGAGPGGRNVPGGSGGPATPDPGGRRGGAGVNRRGGGGR